MYRNIVMIIVRDQQQTNMNQNHRITCDTTVPFLQSTDKPVNLRDRGGTVMFWNISDRVYLNVGEDFFQDGNCDLLDLLDLVARHAKVYQGEFYHITNLELAQALNIPYQELNFRVHN